MRKCNLYNCIANHEGCCIFDDDFRCDAETEDDLITEEEFEKEFGCSYKEYTFGNKSKHGGK